MSAAAFASASSRRLLWVWIGLGVVVFSLAIPRGVWAEEVPVRGGTESGIGGIGETGLRGVERKKVNGLESPFYGERPALVARDERGVERVERGNGQESPFYADRPALVARDEESGDFAALYGGVISPADDPNVFLRRDELAPRSLIEDADREALGFEADGETEAVEFTAADPGAGGNGDRSGAGTVGSRSLLGSETFTTNDSYNVNSSRTQFIGNGRFSVQFGGSYVYDSNPFLLSKQRSVSREVEVTPATAVTPAVTRTETSLEDQEIVGGSLFLADLTLDYRGGVLSGPGLYYSIVYGVDYYGYESSSASGNSLDHALRGEVGLRGGFTEIKAFAGFAQNSGNGFGVGRQSREAPQAESLGYDAGISVTRRLASGSLELGFASQLQEYETSAATGSAVSDRSRWAIDAAWFYDPAFFGYTTLGLGLNYGREEVTLGNSQFSFTPSVRARWAPTALTKVGAWVGAETRWFDGGDATDPSTAPVFGIDASWQARHSTSLSVGLTRNVQQSITRINQNATTTTASLALNQKLRNGRSAKLDYRYEFADYAATSLATAPSGQRDNYHQFGASLSQRFDFENLPDGDLSVFYNYNVNKGDSPELEYAQHLLGLRMGFTF